MVPIHRRADAQALRALALSFLAALALPAAPLAAQAQPPVQGVQRTLELGKDKRWADMTDLAGVAAAAGRWGFNDLVLADGGAGAGPDTELLFHLDTPSASDAADAYAWDGGKAPLVRAEAARLGAGGAAFQDRGAGVGIVGPASGALLSRGAVWGDFSIELWVYPARLAEGETILSWEGGARSATGGVAAQSIRCFVRDRRLVWEIRNLFQVPGGERLSFSLAGMRQLLPRAWHHHVLRFDSREGLLEYALDGVVEASALTTDTGHEGGSIAVPAVGGEVSGPLEVGERFTGFIDELRIERAFVDEANPTRYPGRTGTAVSRVIDLGYASTRIDRFDAVLDTPADSSLELYYNVSDQFHRALTADATGWQPLTPGAGLSGAVRGRYVQLMAELFPDGTGEGTPHLSSLAIVYEPNLPPEPPVGLKVQPGNGKITVSWRAVNDLDVAGYQLYYGTERGSYFATGATQGDSPIDVGSVTSFELSGLENGKLYHFSVAAYDSSQPRQIGRFSAEVSGRPSRVYP